MCTSVVTDSLYIKAVGFTLTLFELKLHLRWRSTNQLHKTQTGASFKRNYKQRLHLQHTTIQQNNDILYSWYATTVCDREMSVSRVLIQPYANARKSNQTGSVCSRRDPGGVCPDT